MRAILTYHSIDASRSPVSVDEAAFRRHVAWLASGRVRVVGLEELAARGDHEDAVAVTFDDGFTNFREVAWPLLRERALPVTLFVVTGHVGGRNDWGSRNASSVPSLPLLDWDALATLAEEGVALGGHSRTHGDLRRAADDLLAAEVGGCADEIGARTGRRPTAFCYPYGRVDARVAQAAGRVYHLACGTALRPLAAGDDPLLLPRLDAYYLQAEGRIESWGAPGFLRYLRLRALARSVRAGALAWLGAS